VRWAVADGSSIAPRNWPISWKLAVGAPVAICPDNCENALGTEDAATRKGRRAHCPPAASVETIVEPSATAR